MPTRTSRHQLPELHRSSRGAWLRAAVLGADDGIVSTASLMLGVAAAEASRGAVVTAGVAGLVAGAASMAAGEYVSVSSQRDSERADLRREREELDRFPAAELHELTDIYVRRGLTPELAGEVARQLSEHDALGAHIRDELGLDQEALANPVQAALVSAGSFATGAALPLVAAAVATVAARVWWIAGVALVALAVLGVVGAHLGGAAPARAAWRVVLGGGVAMAVTWLIGGLVGTAVG